MNLLPILTGQVKVRSCDWAVEGKVGLEVFESRGRVRDDDEEGQKKKRRKEDGTEAHSLEKPGVARDLIAGE